MTMVKEYMYDIGDCELHYTKVLNGTKCRMKMDVSDATHFTTAKLATVSKDETGGVIEVEESHVMVGTVIGVPVKLTLNKGMTAKILRTRLKDLGIYVLALTMSFFIIVRQLKTENLRKRDENKNCKVRTS